MVERPDQKAIFDYVKIASIVFWDAYLKILSTKTGKVLELCAPRG